MMASVRDFGAVGDGAADDTSALQAALDGGGTVSVPAGTYRLTAALRVRAPVRLVGEGGGQWFAASALQWLPGSDGLAVESWSTSGDGRRGDWCIVEGLALKQLYRQDAPSPWCGVTLRAAAALRDLWVNGFAGDGVKVEGSTPTANPNCWEVSNCQASECGGNGLTVRGSDSNAGSARQFSANANGGWGVSDESFLGNTYLACHARSNALGAYRSTGGVNYSTFVGCYAEADQPSCEFNDDTVVLGGQYGCAVYGGNRILPGDGCLRLQASRPDVTPLRVVGVAGQTAPAVAVENESENVRLWLTKEGGLCVREGSEGIVFKALEGQPALRLELLDRTTGYQGPVGDVVFRSSGGGYGDAEAVVRLVGPDSLPAEVLRLRGGRAEARVGGQWVPLGG